MATQRPDMRTVFHSNSKNNDIKKLPTPKNQAGGDFYKNVGAGAVAAAAVLVGAKVVMDTARFVGNLVFGSNKKDPPKTR